MIRRITWAAAIGLPIFGIALLLIYGVTGWQLPVYDGATFGLALLFIWLIAALYLVKEAAQS